MKEGTDGSVILPDNNYLRLVNVSIARYLYRESEVCRLNHLAMTHSKLDSARFFKNYLSNGKYEHTKNYDIYLLN